MDKALGMRLIRRIQLRLPCLKQQKIACSPMRLLFDESIPYRLRRFLPNHSVRTVVEMGWGGTKNGKLLALAGTQFDALITVDKNMQHQQNLRHRKIAME